jgi:MFS transporter, OFA family, oxalate/formate antiporter
LKERTRAAVTLAGCCGAIFWPGAFIFSLPGIMGDYWQTAFSVGRGEVGRTMFFVLAGAGTFMFMVGKWQERVGPKRMVAVGALLCGGSTLLLGRAHGIQAVWAWAYAVGTSSAFVYIPALTVAQLWYPQRRGLASGLVNLSFGLSAAVMAPAFGKLLSTVGPKGMTALVGSLALVIGLGVSPWIQRPGRTRVGTPSSSKPWDAPSRSLTVTESLRTRAFWGLWLTWALAGAAGISMVTMATSFAGARGLAAGEGVFLLTAFNLTNGTSRVVSGYLSDRIGRRIVMSIAFGGAGIAYALMSFVHGLALWSVMAAMVGFAFGTLFSVSAPLASERFGMQHFGAIFGLIFTAYGFLAGILGPWVSGHILDVTQENYTLAFGYLGAFFLAPAVLIHLVGPVPRTPIPVSPSDRGLDMGK